MSDSLYSPLSFLEEPHIKIRPTESLQRSIECGIRSWCFGGVNAVGTGLVSRSFQSA